MFAISKTGYLVKDGLFSFKLLLTMWSIIVSY